MPFKTGRGSVMGDDALTSLMQLSNLKSAKDKRKRRSKKKAAKKKTPKKKTPKPKKIKPKKKKPGELDLFRARA